MKQLDVVPDRFPKWVRAAMNWWQGSPAVPVFDPARPFQSTRFEGQSAPTPPPATTFGEATFAGTIITVSFAASEIAKVLPPGFQLAGRSDGSTEHPALVLTGRQSKLRAVAGGVVTRDPGNYQEAILLIPFTVANAATGVLSIWHNFVARMYLSQNAPAVHIGNTIYQYSKLDGVFTPNYPGGTVVDDGVNELLDIKVLPATSWTSVPTSSTAPLNDLLAVLRMPALGFSDVNPPLPALTCSFFEWDVSEAEYGVASGASVEFERAFRTGMATWPLSTQLSGVDGGCFHVKDIVWRLAVPPPQCKF